MVSEDDLIGWIIDVGGAPLDFHYGVNVVHHHDEEGGGDGFYNQWSSSPFRTI